MWNAGSEPGRIIEIFTPGDGFENYFRELGKLLMSGEAKANPGVPLHDPADFIDLATKYGLTNGMPDWLDDVIRRYGLTPAPH